MAQALEILLFLWRTLCVDLCCPGINYLFDKRGTDIIDIAFLLGIIKLFVTKY